MNFSDYVTDHGKRINKEHFIHLVQVSKVDGKISSNELGMLHKEGKKFGLTDPEIDSLIFTEKEHHYHPPYNLSDKFDHIYSIAGMIMADDVVTESELKIIRRFSIEAGFRDSIIDDLIKLLIDGIKNGVEEEELFKTFKKTILE